MKLFELPVNTMIELQFDYLGGKHRLGLGLLYKMRNAIYISAIKNLGKTIPAVKLKNVNLIYKTDAGFYTFHNVMLRSISYNGQSLYAVHSDQDVQRVYQKNTNRLFIGTSIAAKVTTDQGSNNMHCILKDISSTGMGILSNKKIDKTAKIEISFRMNDNIIEKLSSNIMNTYEFKNGKGYYFECEFDEPNEIIGKYVAKQKEVMSSISQNGE